VLTKHIMQTRVSFPPPNFFSMVKIQLRVSYFPQHTSGLGRRCGRCGRCMQTPYHCQTNPKLLPMDFKYLPTNCTPYCITNIYIAIRAIVDLETHVFCLIIPLHQPRLPLPLSRQLYLAIVTALSRQLLAQTGKNASRPGFHTGFFSSGGNICVWES